MARPQNFDLELAGASATAADEPFDPNPSYTYSYQVAADDEQTYIAHQEQRDNSVVTGEYSYVDPLGTLITVRYTADAEGYREERTEQANFVQIRSRPAVAVAQPAVVAEPVKTIIQQAKPVIQTAVAQNNGASDSDLVAKIIVQLTPFIKTTVSSSLGGASAASAPAPAPVRTRPVQAVVAKPAAV